MFLNLLNTDLLDLKTGRVSLSLGSSGSRKGQNLRLTYFEYHNAE
jgi:hypothetical protein